MTDEVKMIVEHINCAEVTEPAASLSHIKEIIAESKEYEERTGRPACEKKHGGGFDITAADLEANNFTPLRAFIEKQNTLHEQDPEKYPNWNKYRGAPCVAGFGRLICNSSGVPTGQLTESRACTDYRMDPLDVEAYATNANAEPCSALPSRRLAHENGVFGLTKMDSYDEPPNLATKTLTIAGGFSEDVLRDIVTVLWKISGEKGRILTSHTRILRDWISKTENRPFVQQINQSVCPIEALEPFLVSLCQGKPDLELMPVPVRQSRRPSDVMEHLPPRPPLRQMQDRRPRINEPAAQRDPFDNVTRHEPLPRRYPPVENHKEWTQEDDSPSEYPGPANRDSYNLQPSVYGDPLHNIITHEEGPAPSVLDHQDPWMQQNRDLVIEQPDTERLYPTEATQGSDAVSKPSRSIYGGGGFDDVRVDWNEPSLVNWDHGLTFNLPPKIPDEEFDLKKGILEDPTVVLPSQDCGTTAGESLGFFHQERLWDSQKYLQKQIREDGDDHQLPEPYGGELNDDDESGSDNRIGGTYLAEKPADESLILGEDNSRLQEEQPEVRYLLSDPYNQKPHLVQQSVPVIDGAAPPDSSSLPGGKEGETSPDIDLTTSEVKSAYVAILKSAMSAIESVTADRVEKSVVEEVTEALVMATKKDSGMGELMTVIENLIKLVREKDRAYRRLESRVRDARTYVDDTLGEVARRLQRMVDLVGGGDE